jgi:hypothetical protein
MAQSAQTGYYHLNAGQSNQLSTPAVAQSWATISQAYTSDNSSTFAQFGLSSREQESFDAANYRLFNIFLEMGTSCGAVNLGTGRPDLSGNLVSGGGACPMPSKSMEDAAIALDPRYNFGDSTAEQVTLASGDVLYAPGRYVDQMNYVEPTSDFTYQPRLMGTRDNVSAGCHTSGIDQTQGNTATCALQDDLKLPYWSSSDPRTNYGTDEPHSMYWAPMDLGGVMPDSCVPMAADYQLGVSECNRRAVQGGRAPLYQNSGYQKMPAFE